MRCIEDTAITGLVDLPFDLENEIFELLVVDQVAEARVCLIVATFIGDRSVFNHPTLGYILTAIAAPSVQGLAVEHGDPLASRRDTVAIEGLGLGGLRSGIVGITAGGT